MWQKQRKDGQKPNTNLRLAVNEGDEQAEELGETHTVAAETKFGTDGTIYGECE